MTFANYSGSAGGDVWPATEGLVLALRPGGALARVHDHRLRRLGPRRGGDRRRLGERAAGHRALGPGLGRGRLGLARAPWCWPRPSLPEAAAQGEGAFLWIMRSVLPRALVDRAVRRDRRGPVPLRAGHGDLGLADGVRLRPRRRAAVLDGRAVGLPRRRSPAVAIWAVAAVSVLFTLHTPVYSTITAVCTIFLYVSYVLPTALGALGLRPDLDGDGALGPRPLVPAAGDAQRGRLRRADRDRHAAAERAIGVGRRRAFAIALAAAWFGGVRHRFPGPPRCAGERRRKASWASSDDPGTI